MNWGSSPRVRGTQRYRTAGAKPAGIIPACAGNTESTSSGQYMPRDHPRVCGEHAMSKGEITADEGSSPRVRGTLRPQGRDAAGPGIIPACAGNTSVAQDRQARNRDHPRVCGEHQTLVNVLAVPTGSSPRVRGTPPKLVRCASRTRIIPACAGNTGCRTRAPNLPGDHPRVCGEHSQRRSQRSRPPGSSPRVRGTH